MEEQKNEKLDVKEKPDIAAKLSMITRKKPNFTKIEQSSILSRVKAFMPELKKGEVDLWQEMKNKVIFEFDKTFEKLNF